LNGTRFPICCSGYRVQTMLGVTRVVFVLVILRHCHDPPTLTTQDGNLPRIVEVSLFKREHSQVPPTPGVIPLFHRRLRVSYLIQIPKMNRVKVNRCRALSGPQAPQAPVRAGVTDYYIQKFPTTISKDDGFIWVVVPMRKQLPRLLSMKSANGLGP
jgi:hypothetical protein